MSIPDSSALWTPEHVRDFMQKTGDPQVTVLRNIFLWDKSNEADIKKRGAVILDKHNLLGRPRLPAKDSDEDRQQCESDLLNDTYLGPILQPPHLKNEALQPSWYSVGLQRVEQMMKGSQSGKPLVHDGTTIHQVFIRWVRSEYMREKKRAEKDDEKRHGKRDKASDRESTPASFRVDRQSATQSPASARDTTASPHPLGSSRKRTYSSDSEGTTHSLRRRLAEFPRRDDDVEMKDTELLVKPESLVDLIDLELRFALFTVEGGIGTMSIRTLSIYEILDKKGVAQATLLAAKAGHTFKAHEILYRRKTQKGRSWWDLERYEDLHAALTHLRLNLDETRAGRALDIFCTNEDQILRKLPEHMLNLYGYESRRKIINLAELDDLEYARLLDAQQAREVAEQLQAEEEAKQHEQLEDEQDGQETPANQEDNMRSQSPGFEPPDTDSDIGMILDPALRATHLPSLGGSLIDSQSESEQPKDVDKFPYMLRYSGSEKLTKPPASTTPTIGFDGCPGVNTEFVDWLSSSPDSLPSGPMNVEPDTSNEDDVDADTVRNWLAHNIDVSTTYSDWQRAASFFRFDPNETDSRSTVYFPGWKQKCGLKPYQFLTVAQALTCVTGGKELFIGALAMGLGKSAVGIATLMILSNAQQLFPSCVHHGIPTTPDDDDMDSDNEASLPSPMDDFDLRKLGVARPSLRAGASLVVVPSERLLWQWVDEFNKFLEKDADIEIVVAYNQTLTKADRAKLPKRVHHWRDTIQWKKLTAARKGDLKKVYPSDAIARFKEEGVRVIDYLEPNDGEADAFHRKIFVITTRDSLANIISTGADLHGSIQKTKLHAIWSTVVIDECHMTKKGSSRPFPQIAQLPGDPVKIGLSATPFSRVKDLAALSQAAYAPYFRNPGHVMTLSAKEFSEEKGVLWRKDLTAKQMENARTYSFIGMYEHTNAIDSVLQKRRVKQGADPNDVLDDEEAIAGGRLASEESKEARIAIKDWLEIQMVQMSSDYVWKPTPDAIPMPAIDIPPHSAFDVLVPIEDKFEATLGRDWDAFVRGLNLTAGDVINNAKVFKNAASFMGDLDRLKVMALFPCLADVKDDPSVKDELAGWDNKAALQLITSLKHGNASQLALWKYMPMFHALNSMQTLLTMIAHLRTQQQNFAGKGRKIILAAHKPFAIALTRIYFEWCIRQRPKHIPGLSEKDIVFVASFLSSVQDKKAAVEGMTEFKSNTKPEEYQDRPWLLMASVAAIRQGINLAPADVVITLDCTWKGEDDIQCSGRVRRNKIIQPAAFTESYRIIPSASFIPICQTLRSRNANYSEIAETVRLSIEGK